VVLSFRELIDFACFFDLSCVSSKSEFRIDQP
jgi:hypothetical protein